MNRRQSIPAIALGLLAGVGAPGSAKSQTNASATEGVTIVVPFTAVPGRNRAEVLQAMKNVVAVIRAQPGLIEEVLMESRDPSRSPSHVHVARWREQKNWDALFGNADVIKVMKANAGFFTLDAAGVYAPVAQ